MNKLLTEEQKALIRIKFIDPMIADMHRVPLFQDTDRAKMMLITAMRRLMASDENHKFKIVIEPTNEKQCMVVTQVARKDCEDDFVEYRLPINLR